MNCHLVCMLCVCVCAGFCLHWSAMVIRDHNSAIPDQYSALPDHHSLALNGSSPARTATVASQMQSGQNVRYIELSRKRNSYSAAMYADTCV